VSGRSKDQDLIDDLARWMNAPDPKTAQTNGSATPITRSGSVVSDEAIIEKCRTAENAAKFEALFDRGDTSAHGDNNSDADYALLGHLKFYTQDPDQLDRLMRLSALTRPKWDEGRGGRTWLRYSIDNALTDLGETYVWEEIRREREYNHHRTPPHTPDDDYIRRDESKIVWFHELGEPKPRRFVIEKVARKGYPMVIYGAGGVAKSYAALAGGIAIASEGGLRNWLGLRVIEHGYVLYVDFELDVDEQHARVAELCNGLGVDVPKRLAYLSGRGMDRADTFAQAHDFTREHGAVAVIVDSVGQAVTGDMDKNRDINEFFRRHIEPFSLWGTTPILVDHEGKRQQGEKHKDKSIIGGVYKSNNARGVLQFILDEYDKDEHRHDIRVRVPKINFEPPEPFGISITFEPEKVSIETRILPDEELLDEEREPLDKRVYAALVTEPLSVIDLVRITGAVEGSVRNTLSRLMRENRVESTTARPKLYYRVDGPHPSEARPNEHNHHRPTPGVSGDDYVSVADFFANPPSWLSGQLEKYRENPEAHFGPLCAAVAGALDDRGQLRPEEVAEAVREEVKRLA
jgi:AAA domain